MINNLLKFIIVWLRPSLSPGPNQKLLRVLGNRRSWNLTWSLSFIPKDYLSEERIFCSKHLCLFRTCPHFSRFNYICQPLEIRCRGEQVLGPLLCWLLTCSLFMHLCCLMWFIGLRAQHSGWELVTPVVGFLIPWVRNGSIFIWRP